ncbi:hypothetical protein PInf_021801 [Phytophthora infestans]|nr:hypothetical protein PInf_021801 [Phytophthora infestans]
MLDRQYGTVAAELKIVRSDGAASHAELLDELANNADNAEPETDSDNDERVLQETSLGGTGTSTGPGNLSDGLSADVVISLNETYEITRQRWSVRISARALTMAFLAV